MDNNINYNPQLPPQKLDWNIEEDLHLHTLFSDGTLTPKELLTLSKHNGVKIAAITDHDTLAGLESAIHVAKELDITLIPGIELSTVVDQSVQVHLIGLFINIDNQTLITHTEKIRDARIVGIKDTITQLNRIGVNISWEDVAKMGVGSIGRPHIARAMLAQGYVKSVPEAFDKYLTKKSIYKSKVNLDAIEGIDLIHEAGGVAIVAHPRTIGERLEQTLKTLASAGLSGIEVYAEKYQDIHINYYLKLANQYGLIPSGGSDYHGFGHSNELPLSGIGPPPGTTAQLYQRAVSMHGKSAGKPLVGRILP